MTITTGSFRNEPPRKKPKKVSPEKRKAIALLNSIDNGMTLTRFQIDAARKFDAEEEIPQDWEHFVRAAIFALSTIDPDDDDKGRIKQIGIALEALVIAVDYLDCDVEDVVTEVLNDRL